LAAICGALSRALAGQPSAGGGLHSESSLIESPLRAATESESVGCESPISKKALG
jgi:hypothetical protein